jgi:alkylation response protein AidB-like acyl-CoA dehydrogenase
MRATGSNTLIVDDALVPDELSFAARDLLTGRAPEGSAGCHRVPLPAVNGLFFTLPMLGAAEGALAYWTEHTAPKLRSASHVPGPGPGRGFYEETLARCSGEIDAARLLMERVAATADRAEAPTPLAADLLTGVVDRLFRASGTSGHRVDSPLQRLWRDVHSAAGHVVLQFAPAAAAYASQVAEAH